MTTPALIAALVVARLAVMWERQVVWSVEVVLACVSQDALLALGFLLMEVLLRQWRFGRPLIAVAFWTMVAYVAVNVAVARVLPTPLTWPMVRAAGTPIADSIRLYATWPSLAAVILVMLTAMVAIRIPRPKPIVSTRGTALALAIAAMAGHWAGPRVETWGLHRNAVLTLAASALPSVRAHASAGEWRRPFGNDPAVMDLSALSGIGAGRNVVVIGLESVGAQYLKTYGATENVMPHLDALAAHGVVVDQAYTASPDSIRALYSVLCSRYPALDTSVERYAAGRCASLAHTLRGRGYRTALFHSGRFRYLGMTGVIRDRGFDTLEDAGHIGGNHESSFGVDESSTVTRMLVWVDSLPTSDRFLLTYMPIAGHHPYVFSGPGAFGASKDFDRYRSALHEGDEAIGVLIDGLKSRGLYERTIFVVYGDHGQAFAQHPGNVGHTFYLYEENVRVPFFVAVPGAITNGARSYVTASLVDVTPTALDVLGFAPSPAHDGQSALSGPARTALFFTDYGARLAGLRDGPWKFIHELGTGQSRLFHLGHDPSERRDLSANASARVAFYTDTLSAWAASQKAVHRGDINDRKPAS